jgi:phosphohistidine phosphatase
MALFIIRHAHAVDAAENPQRPLSNRGRDQVRTMAAFLKQSGALDTDEIWHSPLARSVETAELFVKKLKLKSKLVEIDNIEGDDDPRLIANRLKSRRQPLAIVGHDPHLSALVSLLVAGGAVPPRFVLKKCAVVRLERAGDVWAVRWHLSPEIVV